MNREELFKKYEVTDRHDQWSECVDNGASIELFRITHKGVSPTEEDTSVKWVLDFLELLKDPYVELDFKKRHDWGILLLTARRMIYRYADELLEEINPLSSADIMREVGNNLLSQPYEDPFDEQL